MAGVMFLLRTRLRAKWASWLLVVVLVALVSGLVLAGVSTARRTTTSVPRYLADHGYDAFLFGVNPIPQLTRLPNVSTVAAGETPANGPAVCPTCSHPINFSDLGVFSFAPRQLTQVTKLVAGRLPDERSPDEVLASYNLEQAAGVHVGTVISVPFASAAQRSAVLSNTAALVPRGPTVRFRVVGIELSEIELPGTRSPSLDLFTTQAFARMIIPQTTAFSAYFVRLRSGEAGLTRFQARARALGGLSVSDLDSEAHSAISAINPQVVGWWILTGLVIVVGMIVLAQALNRQAAIEASETYAALSAVGTTRGQLVAFGMARNLAIGLVGAVGGVGVALALSVFTPVGEARVADPSTGLNLDPVVVVPGAVLSVVVVLLLGAWSAVAAARIRSFRSDTTIHRVSRTTSALAAAGAPPSMLIGVRRALERGRGTSAVPVGSALLGAVLAITAICGTALFGTSLSHLTNTPSLYGQAFDAWFAINNTGTDAQNQRMVDRLLATRGVAAITAGISGAVSINGVSVDAIAGQSLHGSLLVTVIDGHLPTADNQVILGTTTLRRVQAHVGSLVRVTVPLPTGGTRTSSFRVVGTTVLPPDFNSEGLGTGAVFTLDGLLGGLCAQRQHPQACLSAAVIQLGGAYLVHPAPSEQGRTAFAQLTRAFPSEVNFPGPPTNLVNFGQAVNFPLIFGIVLVIFAVATMLHLLVTSVTRRRREVGLLKALGFVGRQIAWSVSWQATTVALVGIVIGIPAGIALGRVVWEAFATNLGVKPVAVVDVTWVVSLILGALVLANLLAVGPAIVAARARSAALLKAE